MIGLFTTFRANTPQLYADVDRTKAKMLNVPLNGVFDTLQAYPHERWHYSKLTTTRLVPSNAP